MGVQGRTKPGCGPWWTRGAPSCGSRTARTGRRSSSRRMWVVPRLRGRRLSEPGMAAVVELTLGRVAPLVSLYVNSYNVAALACYRRVGFRQVGTYATILF